MDIKKIGSSDKWIGAILAWYDYRTSTGKIEGLNNKIKTMKRQAYGYRDIDFFKLKIFAYMTPPTHFPDEPKIGGV